MLKPLLVTSDSNVHYNFQYSNIYHLEYEGERVLSELLNKTVNTTIPHVDLSLIVKDAILLIKITLKFVP